MWYSRGDEPGGETPHRGDKTGSGGWRRGGKCGGEESTVKEWVQLGERRLETAGIRRREGVYV